MKIIITILAAAMLLAPTLRAEETSAEAAARKLLKISMTEELLIKNYEAALDSQMEQFKKIGLKGDSIAELKAEMLAFFQEVMPYSELEPELIKLYSTSFTEAELNDLITFYQTPTGKKSIQLMPKLMGHGMKMGQQRVMENMADLQKRIAPIIQKGLGQ